MEYPHVYRPRRDQGWLVVGFAVVVLVVGLGLAPVLSEGDQAVGIFCAPPFAAVLVLFGAIHLLSRVEVGPNGVVVKRPRLFSGFAVPWSAVESWSVVDLRATGDNDDFSDRAVRLVGGGWQWEIRESEVARPGFESFVADVRSLAGDRERAEPGAPPKPSCM